MVGRPAETRIDCYRHHSKAGSRLAHETDIYEAEGGYYHKIGYQPSPEPLPKKEKIDRHDRRYNQDNI